MEEQGSTHQLGERARFNPGAARYLDRTAQRGGIERSDNSPDRFGRPGLNPLDTD